MSTDHPTSPETIVLIHGLWMQHAASPAVA
jgi:hypothetical protein